jgi:hypothetical protein
MEGSIFYKQVAVIEGRYYSVYKPEVEYEINKSKQEKPKPKHQGGFFVYPSVELAAGAEINNCLGSNWIFPRVILEVRCWGEMIQYPRFKLCFENILPVKNLGFPDKYLQNWQFSKKKTLKNKRNSSKLFQNDEKNYSFSSLNKARKETKNLELEVAEMEKKARMLGIFI